MAKKKFKLKVSQGVGDVAYLYLPEHPGRDKHGVVAKQLRLLDLNPGYKGADIYLDFDKDNQLIGIEILDF